MQQVHGEQLSRVNRPNLGKDQVDLGGRNPPNTCMSLVFWGKTSHVMSGKEITTSFPSLSGLVAAGHWVVPEPKPKQRNAGAYR